MVENKTNTVPSRDEIPEQYKWDFSLIYKSPEEWEQDYKFISDKMGDYNLFKGRILESPDSLIGLLELDEQIGTKLDRLYLYASLKKDTDLADSNYSALYQRVRDLLVKIGSLRSFIKPEILSGDPQVVKGYLESNLKLKVYSHYFDNIYREKPYTLSDREEEILAKTSEFAGTAYEVFSVLSNADLDFQVIKDEKSNEIKLSHARYYSALYSPDRDFRERAYKGYYRSYIQYASTFASLLKGNIKKNSFYASIRNYKSALEASLHSNNIPVTVYNNLIETASGYLSPMHRWLQLRKKILGNDTYTPFDMYVPLFRNEEEKKYSFEDARQIMMNAFAPLGSDYLTAVELAFDNRRIDVFETRGKRSGAYSSGTAYGVEPYILMNWTGLLNDVFTLAHELGHNMHSYFTINKQPYVYADYTIFLAEVASTLNENLLLNYLFNNSSNRAEKLELLEKYMNDVTATFFRQIMFAEFEKKIYDLSEQGVPLTVDTLKQEFGKVYLKYTGPAMSMTEEEYYTWARIPHFYYNFYVYQYATGFAASEALMNRILDEGEPAIQRYLDFLSSGSSGYSLDLLKSAGVDMEANEPVLAVIEKMNSTLKQIEELL